MLSPAGCDGEPTETDEPILPVDDTCVGPTDVPEVVIDQDELFDLLAQVPGWMAAPEVLTTGSWTNWYRDDIQHGLIKAVMRNLLWIYGARRARGRAPGRQRRRHGLRTRDRHGAHDRRQLQRPARPSGRTRTRCSSPTPARSRCG